MIHNRLGQPRPVPAYLLPPAQHWARQAQVDASAHGLPYSHPDRAPGADTAQKEELVFGPGLAPTRPPAEDNGKGKGKAVCHARIDSVASDASATTVATASSSMSRTYSSASSASVSDSDPDGDPESDADDGWDSSPWRDVWTSTIDAHELLRLPQFRFPSYVVGKDKPKAAVRADAHARRLRRLLPSTIRCRQCAVDLAFMSQIMSKGFTARNGRGYLVSSPSTNVDHTLAAEHDPEERAVGHSEEQYIRAARQLFDKAGRLSENAVYQTRRRRNNLPNTYIGSLQRCDLTTGRHIIADVVCHGCHSKIGWKYIDARELDQLYKVGNFLLEADKVTVHHSWEYADDALISAIDAGDAGRDQPPSSSSSSTSSSPLPSPLSSPWPPLSVSAARTAGAIGLADADPLGSVRAINARRHHHHRRKHLQTKARHDASARPAPAHDLSPHQDTDAQGPGLLHMDGSRHGIRRRHRTADRSSLRDIARALYSDDDDDDDDDDNDDGTMDPLRERGSELALPAIEFDSQDEDECEQLFAGTWDAHTVAAQRLRAEAARAAVAAAASVAVAAPPATSMHSEQNER